MTPQDEAHIKALEEENRRLREALEGALWCLEIRQKIANPEWDGHAEDFSAIGKARAALKGSQS